MSKEEIRAVIAAQCDWMFLDAKREEFMIAVVMGVVLGVVSDEEHKFLSRASIYSDLESKGASASFTPHRQEV